MSVGGLKARSGTCLQAHAQLFNLNSTLKRTFEASCLHSGYHVDGCQWADGIGHFVGAMGKGVGACCADLQTQSNDNITSTIRKRVGIKPRQSRRN